MQHDTYSGRIKQISHQNIAKLLTHSCEMWDVMGHLSSARIKQISYQNITKLLTHSCEMWDVMGRLSSALHKNENNTDIPFYLVYLRKLHENILKYYWLNLFNCHWLPPQPPDNFRISFKSFKLSLCLNLSLFDFSWSFTEFCWPLPLQIPPHLHIIIKGIAI